MSLPGNYFLNIPSPNQYSSDTLSLNWTASPQAHLQRQRELHALARPTYTNYPQNSFDSDETLNWRPLDRLRLTADYHQQNQINAFTPYYSLYGNVSYHNHWEGLRADYELPKDFDVEVHYKRSGITRSDASLWQVRVFRSWAIVLGRQHRLGLRGAFYLQQHYRAGLALSRPWLWSARAGYEWTGTHDPGYLIVPQSNNRSLRELWSYTRPKSWFSQRHQRHRTERLSGRSTSRTPPGVSPSPAPFSPLFGIDIAGLPPTFQRTQPFLYRDGQRHLALGAGLEPGTGILLPAEQSDDVHGVSKR